MDQRVGVTQVVEEFVAETLALVGAGHQTGDIEELNGHRTAAIGAGAVVGFAPFGDAVAGTGAVDLEVADGSLGVDRCEAVTVRVECSRGIRDLIRVRTESCLSKKSLLVRLPCST